MFTLIFIFFGFNIELCVFYSMLPVEFLEYTVSKQSSSRFQGISASAFSLLCNHISGLSRPCFHLLFNLGIFYHNWQQNHQDVISSVLFAFIRQLEERVGS